MTQRENKFAQRRPRRGKDVVEEYGFEFRRPTLQSLDPLDRMAMQSSRGRLIRQLVSSTEECSEYPKEFTSYYHGPSKNTDPSYSVTSHTEQKKKYPVISTYPSIVQALGWCPPRGSSDEEIISPEQENFKCRCANCMTKNCNKKIYPKSVGFRDNIMTFSDQFTMTPKLKDASCGCVPKPLRNSEVSVCVSDIVVKDTYVPYKPEYASQKCSPISILKKSYKDFGINYASDNDYQEEAVRDIGLSTNIKTKKVRSMRSFLKLHDNNTNHGMCPRVNIYNEGISDSIANHLPIIPKTVPPPINLKSNGSRARVLEMPSFTEHEVYIPFSHRSDSKYHSSCKKSNSREIYETDSDDDKIMTIVSKNITRKTRKPVKVHHVHHQPIKLPKRVLTSERDIESYIDKTKPKFLSRITR